MTSVLVTGASGFLGKHLVPRLRAEGHETTAMDRASGDISDPATWQRLASSDVVVHLAAKSFVPDSWESPGAFLRTNLSGTVEALEYCRRHRAHLVFMSSYIYGDVAQQPVTESNAIFGGGGLFLSPYFVGCVLLRRISSAGLVRAGAGSDRVVGRSREGPPATAPLEVPDDVGRLHPMPRVAVLGEEAEAPVSGGREGEERRPAPPTRGSQPDELAQCRGPEAWPRRDRADHPHGPARRHPSASTAASAFELLLLGPGEGVTPGFLGQAQDHLTQDVALNLRCARIDGAGPGVEEGHGP